MAKSTKQIILFIFVVASLVGCLEPTAEQVKKNRINKIEYETERLYKEAHIIEYKGMPCIYVKFYHNSGLSCDWSKYKESK